MDCKSIIKSAYRNVNLARNKLRIACDKNRVKKLKKMYLGKRCFIIGNGPSLTIEDLEKLKNEYTFATNRIYSLFNKTEWKPTFYCVQDTALMLRSHKEISRIKADFKFGPLVLGDKRHYPPIYGASYLELISEDFYPELPNFSDRIENGVYEGYSVIYACIQLAVYLGFEQIILLGVDHQYSVERKADGQIVRKEGVRDHFDDEDKIDNLPQLDKSTLAFKAAQIYANTHGVEILNATRGGALDVFERIDFDSILINEE